VWGDGVKIHTWVGVLLPQRCSKRSFDSEDFAQDDTFATYLQRNHITLGFCAFGEADEPAVSTAVGGF